MENHRISHIGFAGLKLKSKLGFQAFYRALLDTDLRSYVRLYALMALLVILGEAAKPHVALALKEHDQRAACAKIENFRKEKVLKHQGIYLPHGVLPASCVK